MYLFLHLVGNIVSEDPGIVIIYNTDAEIEQIMQLPAAIGGAIPGVATGKKTACIMYIHCQV